ncbi:glycosyltransferase family 2 protein [Pollutibacter soli]|uniref:glycosyltransferase family 2 protein n=1 Tax=Pollutibacter soli TaxID=3034157 RepID=UPI0030135EAF
MDILQIIFWLLLLGVFYTYAGYGIFVWLWLKVQKILGKYKNKDNTAFPHPSVAMIIPAYNESEVIEQKINNSLSLKYPPGLFRIVVISDGSNDSTPEIVKRFPSIFLLHQDERKGKASAMNRAAAFCHDSDILVFTDANTMINPDALMLIIQHYSDKKVGGVSGEKKVLTVDGQAEGESAYWKYESFLKKLDAEFYSIVGAAGELFSVRSKLYRDLQRDTILDDFILSLDVCRQGYVISYEPGAVASELPSQNIEEEKKRKKRIGAGAFQGMKRMSSLLNIFKWGKLSFQYISRRVLRWAFCPPALPLIFFLNILIVSLTNNKPLLYKVLLGSQIAFYVFAFFGWLMTRNKLRKLSLFFIPYYFVFMNFTIWAGLFRYLRGRQSVLWEKSERADRKITYIDRKNT